MTETNANNSWGILVLTQNTLANALKLAINKTPLNDEVKIHCNLGLNVLGIILADLKYGTGTHLLMKKEFDPFFAGLPAQYYNQRPENRKWICVYTVAKHIESCIETNKVVSNTEDKVEGPLI